MKPLRSDRQSVMHHSACVTLDGRASRRYTQRRNNIKANEALVGRGREGAWSSRVPVGETAEARVGGSSGSRTPCTDRRDDKALTSRCAVGLGAQEYGVMPAVLRRRNSVIGLCDNLTLVASQPILCGVDLHLSFTEENPRSLNEVCSR